MPFSTENSSPLKVFEPTSADETFFANFHRFADVKLGASRQSGADRLLEQMLPCLDNPAISIYRRALSRLAIAYLGMLYTLQGYTYTALKEIAQQCLNMLKNIEIRCTSEYYQRVFAEHQEMAKDLRTWYEKKICIAALRDYTNRNQVGFEDQEWAEEQAGEELEETKERLKRHTI